MRDFDAYESDMGWLSRLSDEEIEQVLDGGYGGEDPSLEGLAVFARDLRSALATAPGEPDRTAHLAVLVDAAAALDMESVQVTNPPVSSIPRRARHVLTSLFATLTAKLALAGVALATTGALAATGSLPAPAQEALAGLGAKVGIDLPAAADEDALDGTEAGVPDQLPPSTEGSSAPAVLEVIRNWEGERGCEFGHAVAVAAGGNPESECPDKGDEESDRNGNGKPEGTPKGRPEGAGKPEGTPQGKPEGAGEGQGKPEGTPSGKPEGAGKPEGTPGGGGDSENGGSGTGNAGSGAAGAPGQPSGLGTTSGGGQPDSVPSGKP